MCWVKKKKKKIYSLILKVVYYTFSVIYDLLNISLAISLSCKFHVVNNYQFQANLPIIIELLRKFYICYFLLTIYIHINSVTTALIF